VENVRNVLLRLIRDLGIDVPTPAQRHLTPITYSFRTASTGYFTAFQDENKAATVEAKAEWQQ
jgi:hypothetical protein